MDKIPNVKCNEISMIAQFMTTINEPWLNADAAKVGSIRPGEGTPDIYVTVKDDNKPLLRIDVYADPSQATFCFQDTIVWFDWVIIGFGHHLYMVRLSDRESLTFNLEGYYGHLYTSDDRLYVASASHIYSFNSNGSLLWKSDELGIDGIVIQDIGKERISGEGEWDPPGGWKPFKINPTNGRLID